MRAALALVAATLLACGSPPSVVRIVPLDAGPPAVAEAPARTDETPPLEVTLTRTFELCARRGNAVTCAKSATEPGKRLAALDGAVSLASSASFGCAALASGKVLCLGSNERGQLGAKRRVEESREPLTVMGITDARLVATGSSHACAATPSGVLCWGGNDAGETGGETSHAEEARELVGPTRVVNLGAVTKLALGSASSCALTAAGELRCWGRLLAGPDAKPTRQDRHGQAASTTPVAVPGVPRAVDVALAADVGCAATGEDVLCFGDTTYHSERRMKGAVPLGVPGARRVAIARTHGCAVDGVGRVLCWGARFSNPLSRPFAKDAQGRSRVDAPELVPGVPPATAIYVGDTAACALSKDGGLYCWGRFPALGDDEALATPTRVALLQAQESAQESAK